jgi:G:T-mismatch repair DNA endonuclease (very short patch repair protein)
MKAYPEAIRSATLLRLLYIEQKLNSEEIGRQLHINGRLIRTWLQKFHIPLRSRNEYQHLSWQKRKIRIRVVCTTCGKEFEITPCRAKKSRSFYCSRECQIKNYNLSLTKAKQVLQQAHPRIEKICPLCHKLFSVPYSQSRRKYCSDQCKGSARMIACGINKTPSQPELRITGILNKHFPEFRYNGNGQLGVVLGGMIPDFLNVNGKKQVIEVFGDYYHGRICRNWKNSELGKKMAYNSLGYKCLVIWESELVSKTDVELIDTIRKFTKGK